ncbi:MAG: response regulator transcription factor [Burkholderiales bacterium]|nr:response regulator transcription factor [Burkholderiales bacterium]
MRIPPGCRVYLVDDDAAVRDALALLLGSYGLPVVPFADARGFLQSLRADWRGCLLADIRMPGMDGLALQRHLRESGSALPVIIMTGHGDVESAREAFRARAVDFLEKPIDHERLLRAIEEAFAREASARDDQAQRAEFARRLAVLTPREREVMDLVIAGRHNREIAALLNISARTVEVHKARMMDKLMVDNIPELVRLSVGAAGAG